MPLPEDAQARKQIPVYTAFVKYFPDAMIEVAKLSVKGNNQHNTPDKIWWDKSKSSDELDSLMRHMQIYNVNVIKKIRANNE